MMLGANPKDVVGLVGLSYRTAPVEIRELFAFDEEAAALAVRELKRKERVSEVVLLSTCNRTEAYFVPGEGLSLEEVAHGVVRELAAAKGRDHAELTPHVYIKAGADALRHLFRVAASLDSLVVGEAQILGQTKTAFRIANREGATGPVLTRVFEKAFNAAKEVRTLTSLGVGRVSVGSVAVELANKVLGRLERSAVLVVGAGKMAIAVARTLAANGASRVVVANRTAERARLLAREHGWEPAPLDKLVELLGGCDIVITSINYRDYLIDAPVLRPVMVRRKFRPLVLIDISVPRVVASNVRNMEGVFSYDIDDLNEIVQDHLRKRQADVSKAEEVVASRAEVAERFLAEFQIRPILAALRERFLRIRDQELAKALSRLDGLTEEQKEVVRELSRSIVDKALHYPMLTLKSSAREGRMALARAVLELFALDGTVDDGGKR